MSYLPPALLSKKFFICLAALLMALSIASIPPNSWEHEFLLLAVLGSIVAALIGAMAVQHSARMSQAVGLVRREHELFKASAEGNERAFYVCKPVLDRARRVVDFRMMYANAAAERLFGSNRRELVSRPVSAFLSADACLALMTTYSRVAAKGAAEDLEMQLQSGGKQEFPQKMRVNAVEGRITVSALQPAEGASAARIQKLNDFAQSMIESAPISMIATDANGTIIAMNNAAEQLTQYSKHELIGRRPMTMLHDAAEISSRTAELSRDLNESIAAGFPTLVARPSHGQADEREWTYIRKDGSGVWVNLTMTQLRTSDGKLQGYLGIAFDINEHKQLADSVVYLAHHDQLTGLPNRGLLHDRLEQAIERTKRSRQKMAVFMVDVDNFKRVNDSLGQGGGDALLSFVANQLTSAVRRTDTVARFGGDEFVVILPDIGDTVDAERCAAAILAKISTPTMVGEREVRVTASIGCCLFPDGAEDAADLLRNANTAMYEARSHGCGSFRMFSREMESESADRLEMEEDLRRAVTNGEIALHYQPQVRCATGEVTGMEMLMRWNSPKRGSVPPSVFIPVAEEAGLLVGIGEWAMRKACFDCMEAQERLGIPLTVAVNLSARQYNQRNLIPLVKKALADSGLLATQLEFEITEEMLMTKTSAVVATMEHLRTLGVSVAIDDFGTGFSNFSYILQYNVDRLKIDRSFVSRCLADPGAAAIVRSMLAMAHGLKIDVVAEGVETIEQLNFLLRKKCDVAQGFLFSKAVSLNDFVVAVEKIDAWVIEQQGLAKEALEIRKRKGARRVSPKLLEMPAESTGKRQAATGLLEGTA